jgi:hypothetical protein
VEHEYNLYKEREQFPNYSGAGDITRVTLLTVCGDIELA